MQFSLLRYSNGIAITLSIAARLSSVLIVDGEKDRVSLDLLGGRLLEFRRKAPVLVVHAGTAYELHAAHEFLPLPFLDHDLLRTPTVVAGHALFLAFKNFHRIGGHLFERFQADQVHLPHSRHAGGRARHVIFFLA